jgi:hypothetical protein
MSLLRIVRRPDYTSEATQFIEEMKISKPTLEAEQRAGRALLWDKNLIRDEQADFADARVAQQAYVYGSPAEAKTE